MEPATKTTEGTEKAPTLSLIIAYGSTQARFLDACLVHITSLLRPAPERTGEGGGVGSGLPATCLEPQEPWPLVATSSQDAPVWNAAERPKLQAADHEIPYAVGPPVGAQNPNQLDVSGRIGPGDRTGVGDREFLIWSPRSGKLSARVGAVPGVFESVSAAHLVARCVSSGNNESDGAELSLSSRTGPRRFGSASLPRSVRLAMKAPVGDAAPRVTQSATVEHRSGATRHFST
jgi:hypothetical protein